MVGNSMNSENMPWQYPQKSTNLGKSARFAGLIRVYSGYIQDYSGVSQGITQGIFRITQGCIRLETPESHPDENDSHFFQSIQSHYNTFLTQSQVIYCSFFAKIAPFFLDISCPILYNVYVN